MSALEKRFEEDRRLRDTARAVLMDDIAHARTSFSPKGVADRTVGRVGDGAKDVFEVAKFHADDKRGVIAVLIGMALLWFGRGPIMEVLGMVEEAVEDALETQADATDETLVDDDLENGVPPEHAPESLVGDDDDH